MNSRARLFAEMASTGVVVLAFAGALCGCADIHRAMETPRINPESPVAPAVAAGADRGYPFPLLRDVPPVPKNLPQPGDVKTAVGGLVTCRRAMAGYVVDHPPLSGQPADFAAAARAIAEVGPADVPPPDSAAKAEAYAAALRAQAAPPAAINSGPAPTAQEASPPVPGAPAAPVARTHPARTARAAPKPAPPPAAPPAPTPAAAPAVVAEPTQTSATPPLPAPLADPLLARCS